MSDSKPHITIHDIARELGISGSTVSRALNDHPRISKKTKERVRKLAEEHNYQPNQMAASLRKGEQYTVGLIVPNVNRSFFSKVIFGIESVLSAAGYNLMICQSLEQLQKEKQALTTLVNARVDAIFMSISMETDSYEHIQAVLDKGIKMVFFDRIPTNLPIHSVAVDNKEASYRITKELISQGRKNLCHVGGYKKINVYSERREGFLKAVNEEGIKPDSIHLIEEDVKREGGIRALQEIIQLGKKIDAIVCSGDFTALGILLEAKRNGIKVPEELAVTGFANEEFTEYVSPAISSIDQNGEEMGKLVAETFLNLDEKDAGKQVELEAELILRASSGN